MRAGGGISWRRHLWTRLLCLGVGAVAAIVLLESVARLIGAQGDVFQGLSPELYATFVPGMTGTYVSASQPEIRTRVQINSRGYRGPEFDRAARLRIVFLGDSFTAGMQVEDEHTFARLVESRLRRRHPSVAAFNLGVDGIGTGLELLHWRTSGRPLAPQIVVLQFSVANDFADNSAELGWKAYYPHWVLREDGLHRVSPRVGLPAWFAVVRHSKAAGLLVTRWRAWSRPSATEPCYEAELYRRAPIGPWDRAIAVTLALVDRLVAEVRESGAKPLVLLVPTRCQVEHSMPATAQRDLTRPQTLVASRLAGRAQVVDLLPLVREEAGARGGSGWYRFERDGHFNVAGHDFVAQKIVDELLADGSDTRMALEGLRR